MPFLSKSLSLSSGPRLRHTRTLIQKFLREEFTLSDGIAHKEGVACCSVVGPPNWEFVGARHREVLNIPLDPQETGRMLLK